MHKVEAAETPSTTGFYVETCATNCSGFAFHDQYYDNAYLFGAASLINISKEVEVTGINFRLNEIISGDVDGDEDVDLVDLIKGLQLMSAVTPTGIIFKTADINEDNRMGMAEVLFILNNLSQD